jgi:heparanase 1
MKDIGQTIAAILPIMVLCACAGSPANQSGLSSLQKLGVVDRRYQAFNVEMVEVTGGRFWAPYCGPESEVYRQRPPIDLTNPKLRHLAEHLAPSLMRVSGTWANNTYLAADGEALTAPPQASIKF